MNNNSQKYSYFDKFIHDFATKKLETRVKVVSVIALCLIILTIVGASFLLSRSFLIIEKGHSPIIKHNIIELILPKEYESFLTEQKKLLGEINQKGLVKFDFAIQNVVQMQNNSKFTLLLKDPNQYLKNMKSLSFVLYLEEKTYFEMLLEKID